MASVDDNSIRVWDTRTCDQLYELRQHKGLAFVLECHPTDSRIGMWGAYDGMVHIFDLATGTQLSRCGLPFSKARSDIMSCRRNVATALLLMSISLSGRVSFAKGRSIYSDISI